MIEVFKWRQRVVQWMEMEEETEAAGARFGGNSAWKTDREAKHGGA